MDSALVPDLLDANEWCRIADVRVHPRLESRSQLVRVGKLCPWNSPRGLVPHVQPCLMPFEASHEAVWSEGHLEQRPWFYSTDLESYLICLCAQPVEGPALSLSQALMTCTMLKSKWSECLIGCSMKIRLILCIVPVSTTFWQVGSSSLPTQDLPSRFSRLIVSYLPPALLLKWEPTHSRSALSGCARTSGLKILQFRTLQRVPQSWLPRSGGPKLRADREMSAMPVITLRAALLCRDWNAFPECVSSSTWW